MYDLGGRSAEDQQSSYEERNETDGKAVVGLRQDGVNETVLVTTGWMREGWSAVRAEFGEETRAVRKV